MDLPVLMAIAAVLIVSIIFLAIFKQRASTEEATPPEANAAGTARPAAGQQRQVPRRAQVQRGVARNRRLAGRQEDSDAEVEEQRQAETDEDVAEAADELFDGKMGAKKRAKLEAKAEKKAQRESEQRMREDKKKREAALEKEREREAEAIKAEEQRKLEAEKKAQEEKERKEQDEYLAMKAAFSVEAEGFEEGEREDEENSLRNFVQHIKDSKVVVLEDLAMKFKLKTQAVIDRITQLQEDGIITGVIDDRGKFIYVSKQELEGVAKFIRQRGRVSIADLASASDTLINLTPVQPTVVQ